LFWYESEVQNGGHLQYFENCGTERLAETIAALGSLGAPCHQEVLREAGALWHERLALMYSRLTNFTTLRSLVNSDLRHTLSHV